MFDALQGPIHFVVDSCPENQVFGVVSCLVLLACLAAFAFKRNGWTTVLVVAAALGWVVLGVIGAGIGC